ncbi:hypothetical protein BSL82_12770 [Tardibacter chloracetimidivorans]|uniref:DUF1491 family protein n=1 Tax=Tardibacter chloracetimidivorans TaxID=1921510 RepID=A0A1L3ZWT4_9SPHN|nr:DUF1491 family protein [Tardibacter chloracetimidivorans]API60070.1 hypothetical protein BSL82_12770 [Tardibacter chloracetimidivorans]
MTDARLTTAIRVSALIRRVNSEGGHATVLSKGDATGGAILLILCERGRNQRFFERTLDQNGAYRWGRTGGDPGEDHGAVASFIERRRRIDPDLWVVELDVAHPERFIDEPFMKD